MWSRKPHCRGDGIPAETSYFIQGQSGEPWIKEVGGGRSDSSETQPPISPNKGTSHNIPLAAGANNDRQLHY